MGQYKLGRKSQSNLDHVHPYVVAVVERAIEITEQDFTVFEGERDREQQEENIANGNSWTMDTKHFKQDDGFVHAVDLVPWIDGKAEWDWDGCFEIARAMRQAADELGVRIRWGGCWQEISGTSVPPKQLRDEYIAKRKRQRRKATPDGPHFELLPSRPKVEI